MAKIRILTLWRIAKAAELYECGGLDGQYPVCMVVVSPLIYIPVSC